MAEQLTDKVAIITGAATGIGLGIAKCYLEEGAKVVLTGHRPYDETNELLAQYKNDAEFQTLEVTDEDDWRRVVKETVDKYGHLDIVVNNAGVAPTPGPVDQETLEDWNRVIDINLTGTFLGVKHGMLAMKGRGGSIINISSIEGFVGVTDNAAYNASKGGTRLLTKAAALDAGKNKYNVRVNSVHPGFIDTKIVPDEMKPALGEATPVGHIGKPEDIGNICVYLGGDGSSFATGAEFVIDGGFIAQ